MQIITLFEPFPHYIIHDFFTGSELNAAWDEINMLHKTNSFKDNKHTADPSSRNKIGVILDEYYKDDRSKSNILTAYNKLFQLDSLIENKHLYKFVLNSNYDSTFLSYYLNGGCYLPHEDFSVMSTVFTLWKEPKQFNGGDLWFPENNYTPTLHSNSLIIFASHQIHEVKPIESNDNDIGSSRYSISKFILKNVVITE